MHDCNSAYNIYIICARTCREQGRHGGEAVDQAVEDGAVAAARRAVRGAARDADHRAQRRLRRHAQITVVHGSWVRRAEQRLLRLQPEHAADIVREDAVPACVHQPCITVIWHTMST